MNASLLPAMTTPTDSSDRVLIVDVNKPDEDLFARSLRIARLAHTPHPGKGRTVLLNSATLGHVCTVERVFGFEPPRARLKVVERVRPAVSPFTVAHPKPMMFLGAHHPNWLWKLGVPLFVSHRSLCTRVSPFPRALAPWALDSGGFTYLQQFGRFPITPREYVQAVARYVDELGGLMWAAIQDWMCEPAVRHGGQIGRLKFAGTHLTVAEHQRRTVQSFFDLVELWPQYSDAPVPFRPTLQGFEPDEYLACWDLYEAAGVNLADYSVVPVGSVCRREGTEEIAYIFSQLNQRDPEVRWHGFGVKTRGLSLFAHLLWSVDSLAWSAGAREGDILLEGCTTHKTCSNCPDWALQWYDRITDLISSQPRQYGLADRDGVAAGRLLRG